jgi:hypothetical protein
MVDTGFWGLHRVRVTFHAGYTPPATQPTAPAWASAAWDGCVEGVMTRFGVLGPLTVTRTAHRSLSAPACCAGWWPCC